MARVCYGEGREAGGAAVTLMLEASRGLAWVRSDASAGRVPGSN